MIACMGTGDHLNDPKMETKGGIVFHCKKLLGPRGDHFTLGTARPSARLGCAFVYTGSPALIAAVKLGHCSDSTACREQPHVIPSPPEPTLAERMMVVQDL